MFVRLKNALRRAWRFVTETPSPAQCPFDVPPMHADIPIPRCGDGYPTLRQAPRPVRASAACRLDEGSC